MVIHINKLFVHTAVVTHIVFAYTCTAVNRARIMYMYPDKKYCILVPGIQTNTKSSTVPVHIYDHEQVWQPYAVDPILCVCVCVFSSHPFWTSSSLDVPAGVTQEEGHTGFLIHLPSAVRALIFVARRIQPFLSLVDREVEFCVLTIESFSTRWAFLFWFLVLSEKNPVCRDRTHVPTCQKVTRCQLSYRGRPADYSAIRKW